MVKGEEHNQRIHCGQPLSGEKEKKKLDVCTKSEKGRDFADGEAIPLIQLAREEEMQECSHAEKQESKEIRPAVERGCRQR